MNGWVEIRSRLGRCLLFSIRNRPNRTRFRVFENVEFFSYYSILANLKIEFPEKIYMVFFY